MPATAKLDLYKVHKAEYVTPKKPVLIQTKRAKYLAFTGRGAPASEAFQKAVGALYNVAYTLKMAKKFAGKDYKVCNLEGLWWGENQHRSHGGSQCSPCFIFAWPRRTRRRKAV